MNTLNAAKEIQIKVFNHLSGELWKILELAGKDKESQPAKIVEALRKDLRKIYGFRTKFKENMSLDLKKPFYLISIKERKNIGLEELEQILKEKGWPAPKKIIRTISADARFWHKVICDMVHRDEKKKFVVGNSEMIFEIKRGSYFLTSKHVPENEIKVNIIDPRQKSYSLVLIEKIDQLSLSLKKEETCLNPKNPDPE